MIDITLHDLRIEIKFEKIFFDEQFYKRWSTFVDDKWGVFHTGKVLGFSEGMHFLSEDKSSIIYYWDFPPQYDAECYCVQRIVDTGPCTYCNGTKTMRKSKTKEMQMLVFSLQFLFNYEFEDRFPDPRNIETQSFDLCTMLMMYSGRIYPRLLNFIKSSDDTTLSVIERYMQTEMQRIDTYMWGRESMMTVNLNRDYFFLQVPGNGVWLELDKGERRGLRSFSLHNVDHTTDYFTLLIGIIALNTLYNNAHFK